MDHVTTFRIPIEKIPEAKHWKVGGRYKVTAEVEQTGINKERDYSTDEPIAIGPSSSRRRKHLPKYRTMVEFKVYNVSAKSDALKKKLS